MKQDFKTLSKFITEMKNTSSGNDKKEIIKKYKDNEFIVKVISYTCTPFKKYHVSSANLIENKNLTQKYTGNLFNLLDDLSSLKYTGHEAISYANGFIEQNKEYEEIIHTIFDRNLQIRADEKIINKIIPGTIPTFDVALATKYEPGMCHFKNETFYASRKLDGVRCVVIVDGKGDVTAWSRVGNQFETTGKIEEEVKQLNLKNTVLDGELCLINPNGTDNFSGVMSEVRRKTHTIQNPRYKIFDCLQYSDFLAGTSKSILSERLNVLSLILKGTECKYLEMLQQEIVKNNEDFLRWSSMVSKNKWEGFMLRKDTIYEGKRSKNLLKVKTFMDAEFVVRSVEFDEHRIIKDGKEVTEKMLANVIIRHKGNDVSVGSGFSQEQRRYYYKNPGEIIGKLIQVKYFEETVDKTGKISLRFPTLNYIYENGRTV